jgi:hypothetical protein
MNEASGRNMRKKSASSSRYATICNFTTTNTNSLIEHENENDSDLVGPCLKFSPSWNSDLVLQALPPTNDPSVKYPASSQIIPAKVFTKFKPVLNVHRRTSTSFADEMKKLNSSLSTDSFLMPKANIVTNENSDSQELCLDACSGDADVMSHSRYESGDLTSSLPNRGSKRRMHVTRSLSYNVGKLNELTQNVQTANSSGNRVSGQTNNQFLVNKLHTLANNAAPNTEIRSGESSSFRSKSSLSSMNDMNSSANTYYMPQAVCTLHSPSNMSDLFIKDDLFSSRADTKSIGNADHDEASKLIDNLLNIAIGGGSSVKKLNSISFRQTNSGASDILSPTSIVNLPTSLSATDLQRFAVGYNSKEGNEDDTAMLKASQDFCHVSQNLFIFEIIFDFFFLNKLQISIHV